MIRNYIVTAFRSFLKNKTTTSLNIIGLAIGIASAMMIFMWVNDELSYDNFHENKDQIYRVLVQEKGKDEVFAHTPGLLAAAVKDEIPEIKYASRVIQNFRNPWKYEDKAFYEDQSYCADADFFKMFSFPIVEGNSDSPFENPTDIVITKHLAEKYFGKENPIGKTMRWNNWSDFKISAVVDDIPANSSINFEIIESHQNSERFWKGGYNWTNFIHETYIQLKDNSNASQVQKKVEEILNKNCKIAERYFLVYLQPLNDLHLNAGILNSFANTNDKTYILIFTFVAIGILLLACINFINISTANSITRAKEVGIRKVIGAYRSRIILQFLVEFIMLAFIASIFSVVIVDYALPFLNDFTGKTLELNWDYIGISFLIILFTVLTASIYPAFYLSLFSPERILKNKLGTTSQKNRFRNVLVISQFSISILLIICTIIFSEQLSFIQNKKLGFTKDNVLYVPAKDNFAGNFELTKNRLLENPNITGVTMQQSIPTTTISGSWVHYEGQTKQDIVLRNTQVTSNYFSTMNIHVVKGRSFSEEFSTDKGSAFILNEAAVDFLEFDNPIGMEIETNGRKGKIIGVVANSNFRSLHHPVQPLIFMELNNYTSINLFGVVMIKFTGNDVQSVVEEVKAVWNEYNSYLPFEYHFLDQHYDQQYSFEKGLKSIFELFSVLAVVISILGLFGLTILLTNQRIKEIGIRKVLGATVSEINGLLTKDFMKWIIIANILAWPIAYYLMNKWLENFAYKIEMSWFIFVFSGGITLLIALTTVSFYTIKAAFANPVESLRNE